MGKAYRKRHKKTYRKKKRKTMRSLRKIVQRILSGNVEKKWCCFLLKMVPDIYSYATYPQVWFNNIDPPLSAYNTNSNYSQQEWDRTNWYTGSTDNRWVGVTPFAIMQGSKIKRLKFKLRITIEFGCFKGGFLLNDLWVPQTNVSDLFNDGSMIDHITAQNFQPVRISLLRPRSEVSDAAFEAYLGTVNAAKQMVQYWNPKMCWVMYDKEILISQTKPRVVLKPKFKGKRGAQNITFPINNTNGQITSSIATSRKIYYVIQNWKKMPAVTADGHFYQCLPVVYTEVMCQYIDL